MKANYLNLQIQTRGYHGLSLLGSYAIRKTITTSFTKDYRGSYGAPCASNVQDPNNLNECYGVAAYEVPQRWTLNYAYDLPFGRGRQFMNSPSTLGGKIFDKIFGGWGVAGISTYWPKGTPVQGPVRSDYNAAPWAVVRWSTSGDYKSGSFDPSCALLRDGKFVSGSPCGYFNKSAFVATPDYSFGNIPQVYPNVRNPGGFTTDGTLLKNFYLNGDQTRYVNIRVEAANLFNHPNFGGINNNPSSVGFGGLSGKSGNRIMQLGARIFF